MKFPTALVSRLNRREEEGLHRSANDNFPAEGIDFCSNDYLGLARNREEFSGLEGATGSRLISGTHPAHEALETFLAEQMGYDAALLYNSGYDANLGLISCLAQRGDTVLFDEMAHASMRDGMQLSFAEKSKFRHNDLNHLEEKLKKASGNRFVLTESIFSMDGDGPNLPALLNLCDQYNAYLVLDEAHSFGVEGINGQGVLVGNENRVLANLVTFGKAVGSHGACVLGSRQLRDYLVNFSRSFIYTTALGPAHAEALLKRLKNVFLAELAREKLKENIRFYLDSLGELKEWVLPSTSAIQCLVIPERIKDLEKELNKKGIRVKAIQAPTVPKGKERLRICLHSFNTREEISLLLDEIKLHL